MSTSSRWIAVTTIAGASRSLPRPGARVRTKSDAQLAVEAGRGSRRAWATLYQRHYQYLLRYAIRMVRDTDEAQDFVHDAMVNAWDARGQFDACLGSYHRWLRSMLRHRVLDAQRRQQRHQTAVERLAVAANSGRGVWDAIEDGESLDTLAQLEDEEDRAAMKRVLRQIDRRDARLLWAWANGDSHDTMAARRRISAAALRTRLHRARVQLQHAAVAHSGEPRRQPAAVIRRCNDVTVIDASRSAVQGPASRSRNEVSMPRRKAG